MGKKHNDRKSLKKQQKYNEQESNGKLNKNFSFRKPKKGYTALKKSGKRFQIK